MRDELENGLRCIAALTQLHQYIEDKDVAGECRVRVDLWRPVAHEHSDSVLLPLVKFIFEFPQEYETMCEEVYLPEAHNFAEGVEGVEIELLPLIEAINRYNSGDTDDIKCGFIFAIPERWWRLASQHTVTEVGKQFAAGVYDNLLTPFQGLASNVYKMMFDFVGTINEASLSIGKLMSNDPDDPHYHEVRDWSKQFKKEINDE